MKFVIMKNPAATILSTDLYLKALIEHTVTGVRQYSHFENFNIFLNLETEVLAQDTDTASLMKFETGVKVGA